MIGRFELTPVVDDRADYEYAPKLRWYNMAIGAEVTGQVLMSVQVLQVTVIIIEKVHETDIL